LFASVSTLLCLVIGYPIAYGIARAKPTWRLLLLVLVILPFWTSSLLRTYAMIGLLKANGWLSTTLAALGLIDPGSAVLHTNLAVYIGIVYNYLPFMILPLTATLMRLDFTLLDAAADLGARPAQAFARITLPLSMPGIIAGALLGVHSGRGRVRDSRPARRPRRAQHRARAVDRVLHQSRLAAGLGRRDRDAAADRDPDADLRVHREPARTTRGGAMTRRSWGLIAAMAIGYGFLYLPIVSVIAYSFSGSRLATVWGGFSLRWYAALFQNEQILTALGAQPQHRRAQRHRPRLRSAPPAVWRCRASDVSPAAACSACSIRRRW
jgi:ABC-type spermidine/putrescine transport system permease subunit II